MAMTCVRVTSFREFIVILRGIFFGYTKGLFPYLEASAAIFLDAFVDIRGEKCDSIEKKMAI